MLIDNNIKISVRDLVEFIMRSGDLDNTRSANKELDAMQKGSKMHRKIQKNTADNYKAEVTLAETTVFIRDNREFTMKVEGRADGVILPNDSKMADKTYVEVESYNYIDSSTRQALEKMLIQNDSNADNEFIDNTSFNNETLIKEFQMISEDRTTVIIDEIKCVLRDLNKINVPVVFHRAQAMCYAYFYAKQNDLSKIAIRISYCNLDSEQMKYFGEMFSYEYLESWYIRLLDEYAKWAVYQLDWNDRRDESIKQIEFPFEYRPGQKDLAAGVYRTIIRNKKLYIQAPTGVGKTISTVFPTIKAIGEGQAEKIFYLTAKTITRTAANDAFRLLKSKGLLFKEVIITAKDKICILEKPDCNPLSCERAKGHFDRINNAVFDIITHEDDFTREVIQEYALKHMVCPFEMCLDISLWVDAIICDYNYVFDPNVYLRRYFEIDAKRDFVFLIDEAHNLVDRANEMYSAKLYKEDFLRVKNTVKNMSRKFTKCIDDCNKDLLELKRECDGIEIYRDFEVIDMLSLHLMRLITEYENFFNDYGEFEGKETVLDLFFNIRHFMSMYDNLDEDYLIYTEFNEKGEFMLKLNCMNPSRNLNSQLKKGKSAVFFSATFLPITYYKEQLAGTQEDYAIYANSPFDIEKRVIMIANDVSTKYSRRNENEYMKIARYIKSFVSVKTGNYMVFFTSYQFMDKVYEYVDEDMRSCINLQRGNMTEEEKEVFLVKFSANPKVNQIGFCVMGGAFGEGIDLKGDRLIGVAVVGAGLPMVCNEREIFRGYYDDINSKGFDYAYLYNGMNKVLQAAGRVIRTYEDVGTILLLDDRFLTRSYMNLFPKEWFPYKVVNVDNIKFEVENFWKNI